MVGTHTNTVNTPAHLPRVAFQGALGAFGELAIRAHWPDGADAIPCDSFDDAIAHVINGDTDFAAIPVENVIAGPVQIALDALAKAGKQVIAHGEVRVPIQMCLMAAPGATIRGLRVVRTHPVAIAQCRIFFAQHEWLIAEAHNDTAGAARDVALIGDLNVGAIAADVAATRYGLEILARSIQDVPANFTRFVIVSR